MFLAGQIGLDPISMNLVPSSQQPSLSLHHVTSVLEANHTHLTSALYGICYYTTEKAGWAARMTWTQVYVCLFLLLFTWFQLLHSE